MIYFMTDETRTNRYETQTCTLHNVDGYTTRKTLLGIVHEIGKAINDEYMMNVKTTAEAKECLCPNTMGNEYCFELEEVECASNFNEETGEMEYEEATYYFHIRYCEWEDITIGFTDRERTEKHTFLVQYENVVTDDLIEEVLEDMTLEEADNIAQEHSRRNGLSAGNFDMYVYAETDDLAGWVDVFDFYGDDTTEEGEKEMKTATFTAIKNEIKAQETRGAWSKGVTEYALELLDNLDNIEGEDLTAPKLVERALLNGADDWNAYSWGGCSLIYDSDIAERLCNPSELKRTRNGERKPNAREEWLDTQARALFQASNRIKKAVAKVTA